MGCRVAALTHGHPTGWLASGAMAHLVALLVAGESLRDAVDDTVRRLGREERAEECVDALRAAVSAADGSPATAATVESLGAGWVADETLAIAVFCALAHPDDFEAGVRLAVNHSGDSDSTGAVTGNLLGVVLGESGLPARWLADLEARDLVATVADDLAHVREGGEPDPERYPPG